MQIPFDSALIDETRQADFQRKQKLLSRMALSFCAILIVFTAVIFMVLPGIRPGKIISIFAVLGFAAISRFSLRPNLFVPSAVAMVVLTLAASFAGSVVNGGLEGYVAPIMITSPIAAALFLGTRATIISAVSVVLAYAAMLAMQPHGLIRPEPYPDDITSIAALALLATATAFCAAGLAYFASDSKEKITSLADAQTKLIEASEKLRHAALHDTLTGIANRQNLQQHIDDALRCSHPTDDQICVIHIDLDHFKEVNDAHGHPIGDGVLRKAAERMQNACGPDDLVARIGGDEFVIVTTKSSSVPAQHIQDLCETIIQQIKRPIFVNGIECHVGASVGYIISDRACSSTESLITNADVALYESKRAGRGIARQFTGAMREDVHSQRTLINDLKLAFEEDRITCVLQPQISLSTGALLGMEALGRIRRSDGDGLMVPVEFLDTMESVGLIHDFDERVMCKALDALIELRAQGFEIPSVSINASAKSLRSKHYVEIIERELAARSLSHDCLVVEVLESILIENRNDLAAKTIEKLSNVGIKTVIDDFGSGHTSMWALLELQLDGVKIDRSLIANIECHRARTVVEAILKLSQGLELPAIVEGIETPQQYATMQSLGCDAAQGYWICKPAELPEFGDWLREFGRSEVERLQESIRQAGLK
ncbi:MAG: putative bifunctional diguanylate cyclase/phosphodiesterase [Henriciella sp.]